ncbi:MAG: M20/M25/M40 family metallo-hydrolase [Planctomycetes bacterium]|nr:M20/M25/M40 family metallo-hydrolase [Planctomycetota bacterium]
MNVTRRLRTALAVLSLALPIAPVLADNPAGLEDHVRKEIDRRLEAGASRMREAALAELRAALAAADATGAAAPGGVLAALNTIVTEEPLAHVKYLASDDLKGRESGEEGCRTAAAYIADRFKAMGLAPAGDDGTYFQHYTIRARGGKKDTANVVAILPGTDAQLKDELVIVGAHYDHVGQGKGFVGGRIGGPKGDDNIWNGADDNASGTSGVLSIARALAASGLPPRRTILFLLFSGEEKGLLGSAHYVKHPLYPLAKTVAMVNLDMISRNAPNKIGVQGTTTSAPFKGWVEEAGREVGLTVSTGEGFTFAQSDQFSFYLKNVPCLFFDSGMHKDYHRVTDSWDKIDAGKIAKVARMAGQVVWRAANTDEEMEFRKLSSALFGGLGGGKPRLGVELDQLDAETREDAGLPKERAGAYIKSVVEGTAAEKAGMQDGDIVLAFGGKVLPAKGTVEAFREAITKAEKGPVRITVWRDGKELELTATLK